jgi:hypothetical protein
MATEVLLEIQLKGFVINSREFKSLVASEPIEQTGRTKLLYAR